MPDRFRQCFANTWLHAPAFVQNCRFYMSSNQIFVSPSTRKHAFLQSIFIRTPALFKTYYFDIASRKHHKPEFIGHKSNAIKKAWRFIEPFAFFMQTLKIELII